MLAEVTDFELWQRAVRDQFRHGESIGSLLLGVGTLVAIIVIYLFLARTQAGFQGSKSEPLETHPQRLFTHLLCVMGLSVAQRQLLEALGKASGLAHPAALLMSEELFDQALADVKSRPSGFEKQMDGKSMDSLRARLFPQGAGMVQTPGIHGAGGLRKQ